LVCFDRKVLLAGVADMPNDLSAAVLQRGKQPVKEKNLREIFFGFSHPLLAITLRQGR
jgi:hypothetical protein